MQNVIAANPTFESFDRNPRALVWTGRVLTG